MAYIKKEQSVALTYPQGDLQIAVQGPHNTITQPARAGEAPALNSGDSIITILEEIAEGLAKFGRGQAILLQKLEGLGILRQEQVRLIQSMGRPENGMSRLEHGMDRLEGGMGRLKHEMDEPHQGVRGIRDDFSRQ